MKPPVNYLPSNAKIDNGVGLVNKLGGFEMWITNNPLYCAKILHFNEGRTGSLHYHMEKTETWYVQSGKFTVKTLERSGANTSAVLLPGDTFHLPKGVAHQLHCLAEGDVFEVSTPHHEEDTYRIVPSS